MKLTPKQREAVERWRAVPAKSRDAAARALRSAEKEAISDAKQATRLKMPTTSGGFRRDARALLAARLCLLALAKEGA